MNLLQRLAEFRVPVVAGAAFENLKDLGPMVSSDGHDEGKSEPFLVGRVERLEPLEFVRRACGQPGALLLGRRGRGQRVGNRELAGEVGMAAKKRQLPVRATGFDLGAKETRQTLGGIGLGGKPVVERAFGDPRRTLVDVAKARDEGVSVECCR